MQPTLLPVSPWTMPRRIWFLFIAFYFMLLIMDFTSGDELFPHFIYVLLKFYAGCWDKLVVWTGKHLLHLSYPITVKPNGSGDTTYNWVMQLLWIVIAFVAAVIWALADRRRPSYQQFSYWMKILVRYYLALMLFVYGFDKVIKLQFPFPSLYRLTESYGDSSPMGLAWTFVGYSKGYNIFIGGAEVLAGVLLFFKRTTLFGALVAMTVMANVAAMNFAYDIPVKIFSVNLLVAATWIAWFDKERLLCVFFLNRPVPAAQLEMPFKTKWKKILQSSVKALAILFALYASLWSALQAESQYGEDLPKPPLYGIYDTRVFVKGKDTLPPLTTDTLRWKRVIVSSAGAVRVINMADSIKRMDFLVDTIARTARFRSLEDSTQQFVLRYRQPDKQHLVFEGSMNKDSIWINMQVYDINKFRLVNRGFHWINEYPFNR